MEEHLSKTLWLGPESGAGISKRLCVKHIGHEDVYMLMCIYIYIHTYVCIQSCTFNSVLHVCVCVCKALRMLIECFRSLKRRP